MEEKDKKLYYYFGAFNISMVIIFSIYMVIMHSTKRTEKYFLNPFYYEYEPPAFMSDGQPRSSSDNEGGKRKPLFSPSDNTAYYVKSSNLYYYPLYLNQYAAKLNSTDGIAILKTFPNYFGINFYMPNSNQNLNQVSQPTSDDLTEYVF